MIRYEMLKLCIGIAAFLADRFWMTGEGKKKSGETSW